MTDPATPAEREALRKAAEAATPGPWRHKDKNGKFLSSAPWSVENEESPSFSWIPVKAGQSVIALLPEEELGRIDRDAAYIAIANPSTILRLLSDLAAAEAQIAEARGVAAAEIARLRAAPHYTREEGDELCERLQRVRDLARQMMQFSRYGSAYIQGMQEAGAQIFQLCAETAAASGGRDGER